MKKFWKILQGIGIATAGTILAQPEIVTGTLSTSAQTQVLGVIALLNAVLPAIVEKKAKKPEKPATPPRE